MSNFSQEFLASELRVAKLRIACEGRAESIEAAKAEGRALFIAEVLQQQQDKDLAALEEARREHFDLMAKEAENKANERFEMARYMWVNSVEPYGDIDKYPDVEAVLRAMDLEAAK